MDFKDAENHWAKETINDMGSRMVANGTGDRMFEPDRDITRGEFAAIMVKALGLKPGAGNSMFIDVRSTEWYAPFIQTASGYGIISVYGNGKFGPLDKVTREQAMTMAARAMSITRLEAELKAEETALTLAAFCDAEELSGFSKDPAAACIKAGIIFGRAGERIAPKDTITRAESAAIVRRLLILSGLI